MRSIIVGCICAATTAKAQGVSAGAASGFYDDAYKAQKAHQTASYQASFQIWLIFERHAAYEGDVDAAQELCAVYRTGRTLDKRHPMNVPEYRKAPADAETACQAAIALVRAVHPDAQFATADAGDQGDTTAGSEADTILQRADQAAAIALHGDDKYGNAQHQAVALYQQAGRMGDRRGAVGYCTVLASSYARQGVTSAMPGGINGCVNSTFATWQAQAQGQRSAQASPAHARPTGYFKVACVSVAWNGVDWKGRNIPPSASNVFYVTFDPGQKSVEMSFDPFGAGGTVGAMRDLVADLATDNTKTSERRPKLFRDGREGAFESLGSTSASDEGYHDAVTFSATNVQFGQQQYNAGHPTIWSGGVYQYADQTLELSGELYHLNAQCAYKADDALQQTIQRLNAGGQ